MPTSATEIPTSTRFFQPGISEYVFVPSIASTSLVPTRAEITAGDDLTAEIADVSGWNVQSNQIDTPDMGTRFVSQIGGRTTAPSSSITFYGDQDSVDVRTVLPRETEGFILIADGGDNGVTSKADVFPVIVTSLGKVRSTGDQAHQLTVTFAITGEPAEDVTLPALV
jgi:hypothetical protein